MGGRSPGVAVFGYEGERLSRAKCGGGSEEEEDADFVELVWCLEGGA